MSFISGSSCGISWKPRSAIRTRWPAWSRASATRKARCTGLNETIIMLVVLGLIDVVMISNLLIMVIVGGYETFVSRLNLEGHPTSPSG